MKQLCLIAAMIGCTPSNSPLADSSGAAFGEKVFVDGPTIMPVELLEDSRCPASSDCAWPGQVRIKAKWLRPSGDEVIELTSGHPVPLADGKLTLADVKPVRTTTDKIAIEDYRFTFSFAGGL